MDLRRNHYAVQQRVWAAGILIGLALGGCVSTVASLDGARGGYLVAMALGDAPESLRAKADAGYARAEYAYGLVLEFGLQGVARDTGMSEQYKDLAMGQSGPRLLGNGLSSGTHYEVNPIEAKSAEACLAWLQAPRPLQGDEVYSICGGAEGRAKWRTYM